jgi:hypothetical protein
MNYITLKTLLASSLILFTISNSTAMQQTVKTQNAVITYDQLLPEYARGIFMKKWFTLRDNTNLDDDEKKLVMYAAKNLVQTNNFSTLAVFLYFFCHKKNIIDINSINITKHNYSEPLLHSAAMHNNYQLILVELAERIYW